MRRAATAAALLGAAVAALASTPALARPTPGLVPPPASASPTPGPPAPAPAPSDLLPASSFTYVNAAGQSADEHGVIDVIAYGPGLNDSLDIPDRMGWQTLPHTTQYANIAPGCGNAKSYRDQGWSPDPGDVVHNQALFWLSPGSKGLGADCQAQPRADGVQVLYGAASVLYDVEGEMDVKPEPPQCAMIGNCTVGGSYTCAQGYDCVVPNDADTLGESGFEFGRDGLASSVGISDYNGPSGIGLSPNGTYKAAAAPGLADAIRGYITSRGWHVTSSSVPAIAVQGFRYQNNDSYTYPNNPRFFQNSSATFKDGKVTVICAAPPTDPGFCSSNGGGGGGRVTVQ